MLHGKFSSTCWVMYVAIGSDGTTSWRLSENRENGVCCHCFLRMMPCLMRIVAEGRPCCLCVWSTREFGVVYSCHTIVNHRVVWHIILTLRCSMRVFSAFSWLSLQCVVKHWPRGCIWNRFGFWQLARRHVCFVSLLLGVSLSLLGDVCQSFIADGGHDLQMTQRSESICSRRLFCGVSSSNAGGVVVAICCSLL